MAAPISSHPGDRYSFFANSISPGPTSSLPRVYSDDHLSAVGVQRGESPAITCWKQSGVYVNYEHMAEDPKQLAEFLNELLEDRQLSVEAALSNFKKIAYDTQVNIIIHEIDSVVIDFLTKIVEKFPNTSSIQIQCQEPAVIDVLALLLALPRIQSVKLSNLLQETQEHFQQCAAIQSNPKVQVDEQQEGVFFMD